MNSFPKIQKAKLYTCFDNIVNIYSRSEQSLIDAASRATHNTSSSITYSATSTNQQKISAIKRKIGITGDKEGQTLFLGWIEELYIELETQSIAGVNKDTFLPLVKIELDDKSIIIFNEHKLWNWNCELNIDGDSDTVQLNIRGNYLYKCEIVPEYILDNIQQAIIAFNDGRNGAALSLISISLEGALRDALVEKGYTYQPHIPTQDSYKKEKIHIHKDTDYYKIKFPSLMPQLPIDYLNSSTNTYKECKIKRVKLNGNWVLQISLVDELLDFWSSDQINVTGQKKVSGLGAALDIARNDENIIDEGIFPLDLDKPIKSIRNNLIHLSGDAMEEDVYEMPSRTLKLKDYIENKERVFDTICSVSEIVNDLYYKISNNSI